MLAKPILRMDRRVLGEELMDDAPRDQAAASLRELARINRWFGGHWTLGSVFAHLVRTDDIFSVLDVGAASGDNGRVIQSRFRNASVTSLDYRDDHLNEARPPKVVADARALPFKDGSFDFVMCSLFLHHFADREAAVLLEGMRRVARRAVVVLDLERHWLPFYFLPATQPVLRWKQITVHDGALSVAAAFKKGELRELAKRAGVENPVIRRHLPWFRLSMVLPGGGTGGAEK